MQEYLEKGKERFVDPLFFSSSAGFYNKS